MIRRGDVPPVPQYRANAHIHISTDLIARLNSTIGWYATRGHYKTDTDQCNHTTCQYKEKSRGTLAREVRTPLKRY